ncbi:hypothetical protein [Amycolatopsis rubida]|uniref:Uncharacterized protein n=1 Tax=Amycolatopsis rubida TaxID=112413 RepID=A0A1I5X4Y2_9PSEU|nr:hypothetical protein [Amycolatopsis rubida]SFQ27033.1 hypothetical protein SAMN05421854_11035 [Amycolatopsis rubida]
MPLPSSSPRDLLVTGWIGEHPRDGSDVAHLLVVPRSWAISEGMPLVADALGLAPLAEHSALARVPRETARVVLGSYGVRLLFGSSGVLSHPGDGDWKGAAARHGFVIVTCGQDPFSGGIDQLDGYLARPGRLRMGMVSVDEPDETGPAAPTWAVVEGGIAALASALPATEDDIAREAELAGPVEEFFRAHAEPGRAYSMADISAATGIDPQDAFPLLLCMEMLVERGVVRAGPPAGGAGPTWQR